MSKKANKKAKTTKPRIKVVDGDASAPVQTPAPETTPATEATPTTEPKPRKKAVRADGTLSVLDAAAKVLADAGTGLRAKEILERMLSQGLWKTQGKTPEATLYAAIIREIHDKGTTSRFLKLERGLFTTNS